MNCLVIQLHTVSGKEFYLNCDLIYQMNHQYDTVITMTNAKKIIVRETPDEIVEKVIEYKQRIHSKWRRDNQ